MRTCSPSPASAQAHLYFSLIGKKAFLHSSAFCFPFRRVPRWVLFFHRHNNRHQNERQRMLFSCLRNAEHPHTARESFTINVQSFFSVPVLLSFVFRPGLLGSRSFLHFCRNIRKRRYLFIRSSIYSPLQWPSNVFSGAFLFFCLAKSRLCWFFLMNDI